LSLRDALEASWSAETSYRGVTRAGHPAYGQCYPTARVVQRYFPETDIAEGEVWTGVDIEAHFWNVVERAGTLFSLDLSWSQFPLGSSVRTYAIRDRSTLGDSPETVRRVAILLDRVAGWLETANGAATNSTGRRDDAALVDGLVRLAPVP
jgi:hypothetical protein